MSILVTSHFGPIYNATLLSKYYQLQKTNVSCCSLECQWHSFCGHGHGHSLSLHHQSQPQYHWNILHQRPHPCPHPPKPSQEQKFLHKILYSSCAFRHFFSLHFHVLQVNFVFAILICSSVALFLAFFSASKPCHPHNMWSLLKKLLAFLLEALGLLSAS